MIFGHVAVSALAHRYLKADFVPVMAAAAVPDVVDKVAHYVFMQGEGSRWMGHTLITVFVSTGLIWAIWGKKAAWSWGLGYLLHLLGEFGGVVPWLFPFMVYDFPPDLGFGRDVESIVHESATDGTGNSTGAVGCGGDVRFVGGQGAAVGESVRFWSERRRKRKT